MSASISDTTRLILVRHGRTVAADDLCIGQTDPELSLEGIEQVRALAATAGASSAPTRLITSDLRRAIQTCEIIAAALGCPMERDERLREMSFGEWDGRPWSRIAAEDIARFSTWAKEWLDVAPPGGESAITLAARAAAVLDATLASGPRRVILVSHAGWIRAAVTHLLRRNLTDMFEIAVSHARATIIDIKGARATLVAANVDALDGP